MDNFLLTSVFVDLLRFNTIEMIRTLPTYKCDKGTVLNWFRSCCPITKTAKYSIFFSSDSILISVYIRYTLLPLVRRFFKCTEAKIIGNTQLSRFSTFSTQKYF